MLQRPKRPRGNHQPEEHAKENLCKHHVNNLARAGALSIHNGQDNDRQHIGPGVVAPALQLQHGGRAVFQVELLGAQDIKHRGRIRRPQHRADKQALQPIEAKRKAAEQPGEQRRKQHTDGGEQQRLSRNPFGLMPLGAEAAVKDNKDQCDGANLLRKFKILKRNFKNTVRAEHHAQ